VRGRLLSSGYGDVATLLVISLQSSVGERLEEERIQERCNSVQRGEL
jgi:hypothetical protein